MTPRFYTDDSAIDAATRRCMQLGHRIFEVYKFADSDVEHVRQLLDAFNLPTAARVLDAGCGVGEVARLMAQCRPDLQFVLLNISQSQLDLCPREFEKLHGDFHDIPLPDGAVDAVMVNYALGHGDAARVMREVARVLRTDGRVMIYDIAAADSGRLQAFLDYHAHTLAAVEAAARSAGLTVETAALLPNMTARHFANILDTTRFEYIFQGAMPVLVTCTKR